MHLPPRFWGLFTTLLLISGITLYVWAIAGSLSRQWIVMEVPISQLANGIGKASLEAKDDGIYEVELAYPAPATEAARTALVDAQRDRAASGLQWSVHNPRGRVAAGNDGDTLYVVRDHMNALGRLKSIMLRSPFVPPLSAMPEWLASGPGDVLVGIGQWRARSGQSYQMEVSLGTAANPDPGVRLRMRAQRLSWQEHVLRASPRVYAGLLLIVVAAAAWFGRRWLLTRGRG
jgi:hypothetical protein